MSSVCVMAEPCERGRTNCTLTTALITGHIQAGLTNSEAVSGPSVDMHHYILLLTINVVKLYIIKKYQFPEGYHKCK